MRMQTSGWGSKHANGESAPPQWWARSRFTLDYARSAYAATGRVVECAGAAARAAAEAGHAILAARGEWTTNEKRLLERAGLRGLDAAFAGLAPDPAVLTAALDRVAGDLDAAAVAVRGEPTIG